ncbi:MAG: DUF3119 family protein [Cyanobium sp.]
MSSSGPTSPPASPDPLPAPRAEPVILEPRFWVPLGVTLLGPACLVASPVWHGVRWLTLVLVLFGGFLLLQARLLSLRFSDDALLVWRGEQQIRRFPYAAWISWTLFWPRLPVLFYFREERSIHFLPVLFDAATLREQLEQRLDLGDRTPTP